MRLLDRDNDALWDPLSGFYETKDSRWVQFHCNFPHHKEGILRILNCKDSKEAVIKATKKFDAAFLEQTLQTSGMCAAMVRTVDEWQNHPQYQALKDLAIIEITKLQNSEPIKLQEGPAPLSNIKVIDLTRVIAGPICTRTLAEHGADVTLVTSPHLPNIMSLVIEMGHGKKSIHLDLNQEGDCKKLRALVEDCDIFCQSYRPGGLDAKGFSPQYLSKLSPRLIYVSVDAYSHVGPWSSYHGFDTLVQSATGIAWEQGNENAPQHLPAQTLDYVTGYFGALGAMEARTIEGGSYLVRVSLARTAKWLIDLGRCDESYHQYTIPSHTDIQDLLTQTNSAFGKLEHLLPVLKLSETPPYYRSPPIPLGVTIRPNIEAHQ